jgi:hypothetical protein
MSRRSIPLACLLVLAAACSKPEPPPAPAPAPSAEPGAKNTAATAAAEGGVTTTAAAGGAAVKLDGITRTSFNQIAAELALPVFWTDDANKNGALDPSELALTWGLVPGAAPGEYVDKGAFTAKAQEAIDAIKKHVVTKPVTPPGLDAKEVARRAAVVKELAQGRTTLVATDLSKASPEEKRFASFVMKAAEMVEKLYAKQQGTDDLAAKVPAGDTASRTLFFRGQGPKCEAPLTQGDAACSAIPDLPKGKLSGLYPADLLTQPKFCEALAKKDKALVDPFTVVMAGGDAGKDALRAVPYHEAYPEETKAIAGQLRAAANTLGEKEPALKAYLLAAAQAFTDDKWWPADEAWAKMDAKNSRFYLRIGPDEVYAEPCSTKALFHVSFGLINKGSLEWQTKLDPLKTEMEKALAELAGAPYKARDVSFKLPDFVDITLNAGDSRNAFGATIGQSLPNFGPVANEGRGRTVAMTNFYQDADSIQSLKNQATSMLCKDAMESYTDSPAPQLMSTVLHEAAHNLGPAHQYKVNGKIDRDAFGGPLASTLEELKAQTAALYFTDWLVEKKEISRKDADLAHVRDIVWGMGHVSRGMYDDDKHPKNYSQLAAIEIGWLVKDSAITWKAEETAANGKDKGCLSVSLDKFPASIKSLMTRVAQIKGKGDKASAEALLKDYVDVTGDKKKLHETISERWNREPKASFVYSVKLD